MTALADMQVTTLSYVGVKDVAEGIRSFGKENLLAKLDVKIALQEHTEDRWLMGMLWDNADNLEWIARQEGVKFVINDFLVLGAPSSEE